MPNPPLAPQFVNGPIEAVPCPHCAQPNDFREIDDENVTSIGERDEGHGEKVICDRCQKTMEIVQVRRQIVIVVRQSK